MKNILSLMKKLGFKFDKNGACHGYATVAGQAFMLNEYERHQARLKRLGEIMSKYYEPPYNEIECIERRLKEIIGKLPKNQFFDESEDEFISIQAFLGSISIFNNPIKYPELFHTKGVVGQFDIELTRELAQSKLAEIQGGICKVDSFIGVYTLGEIKIYLQTLQKEMEQPKELEEKISSVLILTANFHSIMLGYDIHTKTWFLDNNGQIDKYIVKSFCHDKIISEIAEKIFAIFLSTGVVGSQIPRPIFTRAKSFTSLDSDNSDDSDIYASSDSEEISEEEIIIITTVYSLGKQLIHAKQILAKLVSNDKWQSIHEITFEKATFRTYGGYSLFLLASEHGNIEIVKLLIKKNFGDINQVSNDSATPLLLAAQNGYTIVVKLLIKAGAEINDFFFCTPLFFATQNGHIEIVELLINADADVNKSSHNGITPLSLASQNGHTEIINLLKSRMDIVSDSRGNNAAKASFFKSEHWDINSDYIDRMCCAIS